MILPVWFAESFLKTAVTNRILAAVQHKTKIHRVQSSSLKVYHLWRWFSVPANSKPAGEIAHSYWLGQKIVDNSTVLYSTLHRRAEEFSRIKSSPSCPDRWRVNSTQVFSPMHEIFLQRELVVNKLFCFCIF